MVGFNRRFSPFFQEMKKFFEPCRGPLMAIYRVNAGYLPPGDWQHDTEQGAGRLVGEAGHFLDALCFLAGGLPASVSATSVLGDGANVCAFENAALTVRFSDGSVGVVVYTTHGSPAFSKERLEVFADGSVAVLDDFRKIELVRGGSRKKQKDWLKQDKGHSAEIVAFLSAVRSGVSPVEPESYFRTTLCTLLSIESLASGREHLLSPELLEDPLSEAEEVCT
jgi:predicted dehydrogenase